MKRYHFGLARVLRVRRLQADILRAAYLEARERADGARAAERAQAAELGAGVEELGRLQRGAPLVPARVIAQQDLLLRLQAALLRLEREAQRLEADAARRAAAVREARAGVRGLELLDERRSQTHRAAQQRDEQAQADESAARRFAAGQVGSRPTPVPSDSSSWTPPGPPQPEQQVPA